MKILYSHLGLKIKSGVRKDVMIRSLQKYLVENPEYLIKHHLNYELRLYDDLINHPEKGLLLPPQLYRFPLDGAAFNDESLIHYVARTGVCPATHSWRCYQKKREKSGEEKIENHIIGLVNLRGAIPTREYIDILHVEQENEVFMRFHRFYAGNDQYDEPIVESPFVQYIEFIAFDWRCVDHKTEPKQFTDEEIAKAAIMPYPHIGDQAYDRLRKTLLGFGKSEDLVDDSYWNVGSTNRLTKSILLTVLIRICMTPLNKCRNFCLYWQTSKIKCLSGESKDNHPKKYQSVNENCTLTELYISQWIPIWEQGADTHLNSCRR